MLTKLKKKIGVGTIKLQIDVCTQNELNVLFPVLISLPFPQTKIVLLTKSVHRGNWVIYKERSLKWYPPCSADRTEPK